MVAKKHKSKRVTLKDKYKIQKKVREHRRKLRRAERKNPKKKKFQPIIIPNNYPLKQQLLEQIQREELEEKREARSVNELIHSGKLNQPKVENTMMVDRRALYLENFRDMIKNCSIVFEVLDARDPLSTRSISVEKQLLEINPDIKLVLVLNKIDLVPKRTVENWLKFFRKEVPAIAFKSSIPQLSFKQKKRVTQREEDSLGHETLSLILKNYYKTLEDKKPMSACVIGFQGVGKTRVVESLKKSRLNPVYAINHVEEDFARINKKITIYDTDSYELDFSGIPETKAVLQNLITPQEVQDPTEAILEIIKRVTPQKLSEIYSISEFDNELDFLNQVGMRKGRLAPGGVTNMEEVCDLVLSDWNAGKMRYFTHPPNNLRIVSPIKKDWAEKININSVYEKEKEVLFNLNDDTYNFSEFTGELNNIEIDIIGNDVGSENGDLNMEGVDEPMNAQDDDDDMEDVEEVIPKKKTQKTQTPKQKQPQKNTQKNQTQSQKTQPPKQKNKPQNQKPKTIKKKVQNEDFNFATDFWNEEDQN